MDWLSLSGNIASLIGLLISLVTLYIAKRAKEAAEEARDEVRGIWKMSEVARTFRPQAQQWAEKAEKWLQAIKTGESQLPVAIEIHAAISRNKAALIEFSGPKVEQAVGQALSTLRRFIDKSGENVTDAYSAYEAIQRIASEIDVEFFRER